MHYLIFWENISQRSLQIPPEDWRISNFISLQWDDVFLPEIRIRTEFKLCISYSKLYNKMLYQTLVKATTRTTENVASATRKYLKSYRNLDNAKVKADARTASYILESCKLQFVLQLIPKLHI